MNENEIKDWLLNIAVRGKANASLIDQLPLSGEEIYEVKRFFHDQRREPNFWRDTLNQASKALWQEASRELNPTEQRIVDSLRNDGIAISSVQELFPGQNTLPRLLEELAVRQRNLASSEYKSDFKKASFTQFLHGGGGSHPELIMEDPGISEFLSDTVLHIIGGYLGSAAKFIRFSMQSTRVVDSAADRAQSQRWHRDPDDRHIPKVFIYLNDVTSKGTGPFEYLKGSHSGGHRSTLFPQTPPFGMYPPDGEVEQHISDDEIVTGFGEAGTVIFADTSGLHRGGFSTENERIMYAGIYVSDASLFGKRYVLPENLNLASLPPLLKFALS